MIEEYRPPSIRSCRWIARASPTTSGSSVGIPGWYSDLIRVGPLLSLGGIP